MANVVKLKEAALILLLLLFVLPKVFETHRSLFVAASPATINVFPGAHPTIQEAIDNASIGDVIFVHSGNYYEDIAINKSVILIGEDRDSTIITGVQSTYVMQVLAGGSSIKDLTVRKNPSYLYQQGAILVSSAGNVLDGNRIGDGFYGLTLSSSYNNSISDNIISDNTDGLSFYFSSENVASGNIIVNCDKGISLYSSDDNRFLDNTVYNNTDGLYLYSSDDNRFLDNTVYNNTDGLYLYSSANNNVFYHNNFNNTLQLWSDSKNSTNVWSLNGEGNYWSDYSGQDLNHNGIGDSPYSTDTEDGDSYPLMGSFHDLNVIFEGQAYEVNLISNSTISSLIFKIGEETGNRMVIFSAAGEAGTVGFCRIMVPLSLMEPPLIVLSSEGEITPTLLNSSNETNAYMYFTYVHSNQTISIVSSETLHLYSELLDKYGQLMTDLYNLNVSQSSLGDLQREISRLNASYYEHLWDYSRSVENIVNLTYVFAATTAIFLVTTIYLSKRSSTGGKQDTKSRRNEE